VARTAKELDDVFRLRYDVYVRERGKFLAEGAGEERIVDRFDTLPGVANIVAYNNDQAIAAIRINQDTPLGLPAEEYICFSALRARLEKEAESAGGEPLRIVGGSMLVVDKEWRNRRNVIFGLFKTAAGVLHSWKCTHVIGTISKATLSLYSRANVFEPVGDEVWNDVVGDSLVPIVAYYPNIYKWAFGQITKKINSFWVDNFSGRFQRQLLSAGEILFSQSDTADFAYAVDEGWVSISRYDPDGNEMVLANLSKGALFGELALFDGETRSATATAVTNTELITIERADMLELLRQHPDQIECMLEHFARRLRETDNLALVQAFAPQTKRVEFALNQIWVSASTDGKNPNHPDLRVARIGPKQIAKSAQVREWEVRRILEIMKVDGQLEYGENVIRFFQPPVSKELEISEESPL
jgi:CRP-like cAMP-binding protein